MSSFFLVIAGRRELLDDHQLKAAGAVRIDMEDTIADKQAARALARDFLASYEHPHRPVRINELGTRDALEDLLMIADLPEKPDSITVPKVEDPAEIRILARILP